jgi:hypothetical protein
VAFVREGFIDAASDATKMATPIGRFLVNVARWASSTNGNTVRIAGPNGAMTCAQCITNLNNAAATVGRGATGAGRQGQTASLTPWPLASMIARLVAASLPCIVPARAPVHPSSSLQAGLNITFVPPTSSATHDVAITSLSATPRTADLYVSHAGDSRTDAQITALQAFMQNGGGVILAHQAWCARAPRCLRQPGACSPLEGFCGKPLFWLCYPLPHTPPPRPPPPPHPTPPHPTPPHPTPPHPTPPHPTPPRYWDSAIADFPGNRIFAPLNALAWTKGIGSNDASYAVPAALPSPLYVYNSDVAAGALMDHYAGTTLMQGDALMTGELGGRRGDSAGRGGRMGRMGDEPS